MMLQKQRRLQNMVSKFQFCMIHTGILMILSVSLWSNHVYGFTNTLSSSPIIPYSTTKTTTSTTATTLYETRQAEYGKSSELPLTYCTCGKCGSSYALQEDDLGSGKGRRLECSVCGHSWFQSRDRLNSLSDGYEMIELPERDLKRIEQNVREGKSPKYTGDMKMYIGNISFGCSEGDIWELFESIGEVGDVSLVRDDFGRIRGFGFVTMRNRSDGEKAIAELDGMEFNGRKINVKESTN